ncbi:hypothetical protein F0U60_24440 [Archangium minus]|uniref:Peptidase M56 domain-containing protein n=1 Tax=Archangium minus TaxID=83450 RepID=A0ABY9WUJ5_9BACT|nr:hypothetical protein F0U60_24440 [Archangium minus]
MMTELVAALVRLTYALSAAVLLMLALRGPLRRVFGATLAYQTWLVVPAIVAVALLPAVRVQPQAVPVSLRTFSDAAVPALREASIPWLSVALLVWGAGALMLAAGFWRAHVRFVRGLGSLTPREGLYFSESPTAGPASLGLWRPKVIVPSDFPRRYTPAEQLLIIQHEQVHAERGDAVVNLLQVCLQCVFWFNPLIHWAAVRFRVDQELACDAAVLRGNPGQRRAYSQALLKSHTLSTETPPTVACLWRFNHPIKERIMSLQQVPPGRLRRLAGRLAVASLVLAGGSASLLARAENVPTASAVLYEVAMDLSTAGAKAAPRVHVREGTPFAVSSERNGVKWRLEFTVSKAGTADGVAMTGKIDIDSTTIARPTLEGRLGEPMRLKVEDEGRNLDLAMVVREVTARPTQP